MGCGPSRVREPLSSPGIGSKTIGNGKVVKPPKPRSIGSGSNNANGNNMNNGRSKKELKLEDYKFRNLDGGLHYR